MNAAASKAAEVTKSRLGQTLTIAARAQGIYDLGDNLWKRYQAHRSFTVSISAKDPLYQDVHEWLLDLLPDQVTKNVVAHTVGKINSVDSVYADESDRDEKANARLGLMYNDRQARKVTVDGHPVIVMINRPSTMVSEGTAMRVEPDTIQFTAKTKAGQEAVVHHLESMVTGYTSKKRRPALWVLNSWGSWTRRNDLPPRDLDSVILRAGQLERIVGDLDGFLRSEEAYNRRGIPWHRGYLFHGQPGTGKTSLAKALANHFGLDLWYAPLGDLSKDTSLLSLLSQVHSRSVLLLEDVDVFTATHKSEATSGQVSLSGLLNALDGIGTPHGLITILTTNDRTTLDPALIRPGRIDRHEEILPPDEDQARRLHQYFHGRPAPEDFNWTDASVAALVEQFKQEIAP